MPRSSENQRWDFLPATVFLIESETACSDMATAVESGLHVNALPLAEITGFGSDEETIGVTWEDVKRGNCLAILKPLPLSDEIPAIVDQKAIVAKAPRQQRNGRILRTVGLARTFGAINLASFTVLSVGVTGKKIQYYWKRTLIEMHELGTDILNFRSSSSCCSSLCSLCCFFIVLLFSFWGFADILVCQRSNPGRWSWGCSYSRTGLLPCEPDHCS